MRVDEVHPGPGTGGRRRGSVLSQEMGNVRLNVLLEYKLRGSAGGGSPASRSRRGSGGMGLSAPGNH
eukprot:537943-Alexandrium_andersonii.AAC.1